MGTHPGRESTRSRSRRAAPACPARMSARFKLDLFGYGPNVCRGFRLHSFESWLPPSPPFGLAPPAPPSLAGAPPSPALVGAAPASPSGGSPPALVEVPGATARLRTAAFAGWWARAPPSPEAAGVGSASRQAIACRPEAVRNNSALRRELSSRSIDPLCAHLRAAFNPYDPHPIVRISRPYPRSSSRLELSFAGLQSRSFDRRRRHRNGAVHGRDCVVRGRDEELQRRAEERGQNRQG
jgi:hypothetical protein